MIWDVTVVGTVLDYALNPSHAASLAEATKRGQVCQFEQGL